MRALSGSPLTSRRRGTNPSEGSRGNSRVAPTTDSLAGAPIAPASPPERGKQSPSQEWRQQPASSWFSCLLQIHTCGFYAGDVVSASATGTQPFVLEGDTKVAPLLHARLRRPRSAL